MGHCVTFRWWRHHACDSAHARFDAAAAKVDVVRRARFFRWHESACAVRRGCFPLPLRAIDSPDFGRTDPALCGFCAELSGCRRCCGRRGGNLARKTDHCRSFPSPGTQDSHHDPTHNRSSVIGWCEYRSTDGGWHGSPDLSRNEPCDLFERPSRFRAAFHDAVFLGILEENKTRHFYL